MKDNIILIGFMGAGKTRIGTDFAARSRMPLLDTDQLIEAEAGMSIREIFDTRGETVFRETESRVLKRLLDETDQTVISVGGGLPLREENRILLRQLGRVVFLRVKRETVLGRLKGDTTRPLLMGDHIEDKVDRLLGERNPIYEAAAEFVVDVDRKTPEAIVEELERKIGGRG